MATKVIAAGSDDGPMKRPINGLVNQWNIFTGFLSDVRAEMRKVVAPSRKEVQATTTVVLIAVFAFGLFFFVVDWLANMAVHGVLYKLGGLQQ